MKARWEPEDGTVLAQDAVRLQQTRAGTRSDLADSIACDLLPQYRTMPARCQLARNGHTSTNSAANATFHCEVICPPAAASTGSSGEPIEPRSSCI